MKNDKVIMYLGGGAMLGIFGAGFVSRLQEKKAYKFISAIYGASAGAMNAAYFLSHQTKLGSSIYYEELTKNFILAHNVPYGIWQRFAQRYFKHIPRKNWKDAVNIHYALDIIKNKKTLNIKAIKSSGIKFYVEVLNLHSSKIERLNFKNHDAFALLHAAIAVVPYYSKGVKISNKIYADASIKEPTDAEFLLSKYPASKVVFVINEPADRKLKHYLKNILEGTVAEPMYKHAKLFEIYKEREKNFRNGLIKIKNKAQIMFIHPPAHMPITPQTTDKKKLIIAYNMGKKAADKFLKFVAK